MDSVAGLPQKTPKSPARRLKRADIEAVAERIVKYRMNETQACFDYGIRPKQWFQFKQRHKTVEEFEALINTIKAAQMRNCVDAIREAGEDREFQSLTKDGREVTITKPGDWRAWAWIGERVLSPENYGQQQAATTTNVNVFAANGLDVAKLVSNAYASVRAKAVVGVQEVKQLPEPSKPIV